MTVSGGLSREAVVETVRRHLPEMEKCYEIALQKDPSLKGGMILKFVLDAEGTVQKVQIISSEMASTDLEACLKERLKTWKFPSLTEGEHCGSHVPLHFWSSMRKKRSMHNWMNVYGNRRMLSLLGLGFSSGLPLALTASTLQAWMTVEKVDLTLIGIFSLVGLPYTLKILWAPVMDRFSPPCLGRRRGWILLTQVLLALGIWLLGLSIQPASIPLDGGLPGLYGGLFQLQPGYRHRRLSRRCAAKDANWGPGRRLDRGRLPHRPLVSGALALILSDHLPWRSVYGFMAGMMLLSGAVTFWAPEPQEKVDRPPKA